MLLFGLFVTFMPSLEDYGKHGKITVVRPSTQPQFLSSELKWLNGSHILDCPIMTVQEQSQPKHSVLHVSHRDGTKAPGLMSTFTEPQEMGLRKL